MIIVEPQNDEQDAQDDWVGSINKITSLMSRKISESELKLSKKNKVM